MANIKNLQMWNTICNDTRISIDKSLFGLRTTVVYNLSNSVVDARTVEFSPADGERVKRILETPSDQLASALGDFRPKAIVNGNYMAEVCISRDDAFLAVQLHQFTHMSYEPVTDVHIFEGTAARTLKPLFV